MLFIHLKKIKVYDFHYWKSANTQTTFFIIPAKECVNIDIYRTIKDENGETSKCYLWRIIRKLYTHPKWKLYTFIMEFTIHEIKNTCTSQWFCSYIDLINACFMYFIKHAWFGIDVLVSVYYSIVWHATTLVSFIYTWSVLPAKRY